MPASFEVKASSSFYSVHIESHAFDRYLDEGGKRLILADAFFEPRFAQAGRSAIFIEASEAMKSLDASPALIERIRKSGAGRRTHLVAVGGGILQDVSAFIASIYMRGLEWTFLPTTVLAMVDSCIGGKSSINVGRYKNLVGTFHPPAAVLIDPALAATLPEHERASGLVEAAKICFCRGEESFGRYLSCGPGIAMSTKAIEQVISESLGAKKWFIEIDEFDNKERLLLNFGHTFGHAIEGASHYTIAHGFAVGLGILCALAFGRQQGTNYARAVEVMMLEEHLHSLIMAAPALCEHLRRLDPDDLMERFESDKKHTSSEYTLILANQAGEVTLQKMPRNRENQACLQRSVAEIVERYTC